MTHPLFSFILFIFDIMSWEREVFHFSIWFSFNFFFRFISLYQSNSRFSVLVSISKKYKNKIVGTDLKLKMQSGALFLLSSTLSNRIYYLYVIFKMKLVKCWFSFLLIFQFRNTFCFLFVCMGVLQHTVQAIRLLWREKRTRYVLSNTLVIKLFHFVSN